MIFHFKKKSSIIEIQRQPKVLNTKKTQKFEYLLLGSRSKIQMTKLETQVRRYMCLGAAFLPAASERGRGAAQRPHRHRAVEVPLRLVLLHLPATLHGGQDHQQHAHHLQPGPLTWTSTALSTFIITLLYWFQVYPVVEVISKRWSNMNFDVQFTVASTVQ